MTTPNFHPSKTLNVAWEVRRPVYRAVVARSLDADNCLLMMASVKWDVKDIMSQHSAYVDALLDVRLYILCCV